MAAEMTSPKPTGRDDRVAAWSGLIAAALAVMAWAACCVLPLALSFAGLSLVGAEYLAGQRGWLTGLAAALLATGWWLIWRRRGVCAIDASCPTPSRTTVILLAVASLLLLAAVAWGPLIEPWAIRMMRSLG